MSMKVGDPGEARGPGVEVRYEGLALLADRLTYQSMLWPGTNQAIIRTAELFGGTADDARVRLDTRSAVSPSLGFRGLLVPKGAKIQVIDQDAAHPQVVRYRVDLDQVGPFSGLLKDNKTQAWVPHRGWAHSAELWFEAKLDPAGGEGGVKDLRLAVVVLRAAPGPAGGPPGKRVELDRWKGPETPPDDSWPSTGIAGHIDCRMLKILLAEDGSAGMEGDDVRTWGTLLPPKRP